MGMFNVHWIFKMSGNVIIKESLHHGWNVTKLPAILVSSMKEVNATCSVRIAYSPTCIHSTVAPHTQEG